MRIKPSSNEVRRLQFSDVIPFNFALTARIKGVLSLERLRHALHKIKLKHPLLAARLVATDDGPYFETEGAPDFPIRLIEGDWVDEVPQDLSECFVSQSGPHARFLLAYDGDYTDLVAILNHSRADGLAAAYLLRDILFYVAHPDAEVIPMPYTPPLDQLLPPIDRPPIQAAMPALPSQDEPQPEHPSEPPQPRILYVMPWQLTQGQTSALAERSRQEGTSVHSALCTAFMIAYTRLNLGLADLRIVSSPLSVRDKLTQPVGEYIGDYINPGVLVELDCSPSRDFWEMAREFKASLARASAGDLMVARIYAMNEMNKAFDSQPRPTQPVTIPRRVRRVNFDLAVSNLGRLDFPTDYGDVQLEAIYGPVFNSMIDETIVGVTTAAGKLTCSLVAFQHVIPKAMGAQIKDIAMDVLAQAVNW